MFFDFFAATGKSAFHARQRHFNTILKQLAFAGKEW